MNHLICKLVHSFKPLSNLVCLDANQGTEASRYASTRKTTARQQVREETSRQKARKPKDKGAILPFALKDYEATDDLMILRKVIAFSYSLTFRLSDQDNDTGLRQKRDFKKVAYA